MTDTSSGSESSHSGHRGKGLDDLIPDVRESGGDGSGVAGESEGAGAAQGDASPAKGSHPHAHHAAHGVRGFDHIAGEDDLAASPEHFSTHAEHAGADEPAGVSEVAGAAEVAGGTETGDAAHGDIDGAEVAEFDENGNEVNVATVPAVDAVDAGPEAGSAEGSEAQAEPDSELEPEPEPEPDPEPEPEPEPEPPNPYADADIYEPYQDEEERLDMEEERLERSVAEYSRSNSASHYRRERNSVLLPIIVLAFAGFVVVAGIVAYAAGVIPTLMPDFGTHGESATVEEQSADNGDGASATNTAQPVDINLTMVGDILTQSSVVSAYQTTSTNSSSSSTGSYDFSGLFTSVSDDIKNADIALVDQESAIAGSTYGYASGVPYNAPDALATAEQDAGLDVVLKASNYALDLGYEGLHAELTSWAKNEPSMQVLGVADPEGTAGTDRVNNVYLYEKDGFKVAILNYTYGTDTTVSKKTDSSYVATLSEDKVKSDVAAAKAAGADMIVACPHWGTEYSTSITSEQETYAQLFADLDVDVVIGDHPHVVQPVEVLTGSDGHSTVCYYSLGNFVSASKSTSSLVGGMAEVTLHKDSDGTCSVTSASLVPVVTHRANGSSYGVYRLSSYTDALAKKGWDTYLTPSYVRQLLDQQLSDLTYDETSGAYTVNLG